MIKRLTPVLCLMVACLATAGGTVPLVRAGSPSGGDPICIADRAKADVLVHRERLVPAQSVKTAAARLDKGRVVSTMLCQRKGRYVYQVVLRGNDGRIRRETVDARKPFDG